MGTPCGWCQHMPDGEKETGRTRWVRKRGPRRQSSEPLKCGLQVEGGELRGSTPRRRQLEADCSNSGTLARAVRRPQGRREIGRSRPREPADSGRFASRWLARRGARSTRCRIVRLHHRGTGVDLHGLTHPSTSSQHYQDPMRSGPDLAVDQRRWNHHSPVTSRESPGGSDLNPNDKAPYVPSL